MKLTNTIVKIEPNGLGRAKATIELDLPCSQMGKLLSQTDNMVFVSEVTGQ